MVRLAALIRGQPEAIQDQIRAAFQRRVQLHVEPAGVRIPVSFKIASGIKRARYAEYLVAQKDPWEKATAAVLYT
jgi:hypothetical protein